MLHQFTDLFLHLDKVLPAAVDQYGAWIYLVLFLIVYCETGLVVTPFLPGDSLLFSAGALAAQSGGLHPGVLIVLLMAAAFCGDNTNYFAGRFIGPRVFNRPKSWFFNPDHIRRAREFYEEYGKKAVIIARFVPIIRTCVPFVAGVGAMRYRIFLLFSVIGAVLWVPGLVLLGYWCGNIPLVKSNFTAVIFIIIGLSLLPPIIEFLRSKRKKKIML